MILEVIGLRIEKYIDKLTSKEKKEHIIACKTGSNYNCELILNTKVSDKGIEATLFVKPVKMLSYDYTVTSNRLFIDIDPKNIPDVLKNDVFTFNRYGSTTSFSNGHYSVNMDAFTAKESVTDIRKVFLFSGHSSCAFIGSKLEGLDVLTLSKELPDIITSDVIIYDPRLHDIKEISNRIYGPYEIICVGFSKYLNNEWTKVSNKKN
jgi:hypothetical protein